ncbi:hypothetical protein ATANTOWER_024414 [Ataeniobius toweri]|uniref:Uncharacterized protein n=1 Tax=Ataeniobius toweri TaxID=208326 RepID=A0ABU7C988_9TELE|nr:hypothetical protein [Ataeniobius toweri]
MTSTTSPLCSSTYCSVLGGNISRPLALRIDMSRLDTWFPAGATEDVQNAGRNLLGLTDKCIIIINNLVTKAENSAVSALPCVMFKVHNMFHVASQVKESWDDDYSSVTGEKSAVRGRNPQHKQNQNLAQ